MRLVIIAILLSFCFPVATAIAGGITNPSDMDFAYSLALTTIFPPSDASTQSARLQHEHIVPGFSHHYLYKLGSKIETTYPRGNATSSTDANDHRNIFIGGVVTRPDLSNNGLVVVHRLQSYVSPLSPFSPFSCNIESVQNPVRDAMRRLLFRSVRLPHEHIVPGFSHHYLYKLGMKIETTDPRGNATSSTDADDHRNIFIGGVVTRPDLSNNGFVVVHGYFSPLSPFSCNIELVQNPVRDAMRRLRHIKLLEKSDLDKMSSGKLLPTLESGQWLIAGRLTPMRTIYFRIKVPGMDLPLRHLRPSAVNSNEETGDDMVKHSCFKIHNLRCYIAAAAAMYALRNFRVTRPGYEHPAGAEQAPPPQPAGGANDDNQTFECK
ncbi:hypothetical protein L1987_21243 [Smallanthus sonchifolius]|uniref:Uncharacterized protein n=1 Tax=Smallanthus sonchifolius TaxID=185202 RepID=A0ACB9IUC9_9ASTR|nr:hypothetical protein L1987_21243 [Smallanthus sonchifolius]